MTARVVWELTVGTHVQVREEFESAAMDVQNLVLSDTKASVTRYSCAHGR